MIYFAATDQTPPDGGRKVRYFAVPNGALMCKVELALTMRMGRPVNLTFLSDNQAPRDERLTTLSEAEVC